MNLIVCCTPLQVLIAEKIMEKYPNEAFFGVMLHTVENKKFEHYKQRLSKKTAGFFSLHQHKDRFSLVKEIIQIKCRFQSKTFKRVFVSNLIELHLQFLLSAVKFDEFYTFDDGTINIVESSPLLKDDPNTLLRKSINLILGNKYTTQSLRARSQAHYTIYPQFKNIIENTIGIDLMPYLETESDNGEVVNILLGQPIYPDNSENVVLTESVISRFNIHYYLPHPRETYRLNNVEYIETPLIFEDYMTTEFAKRKCRVYTYCSSAVLNVINSKNIEVVALRIDSTDKAVMNCYELFEKVGINIIDIRK